jgi:hypothetical protein
MYVPHDQGILDSFLIEARCFWFFRVCRPTVISTGPSVRCVTGAFTRVLTSRDVSITNHLHLMPRWRKRGAVSPFSSRLDDVHRENFIIVRHLGLIYVGTLSH